MQRSLFILAVMLGTVGSLIAELPLKEPKVLWSFVGETETRDDGTKRVIGVGQVSYFQGAVYFGDDKGRLFALKADTGDLIWMQESDLRISMAPTVDDDHVYLCYELGIVALDRKTGELAWTQEIKGGANEARPRIAGDLVITAGYDGKIHAYNRKSGEPVWTLDFVADAPDDPPEFSGSRARFGEKPARPRGTATDGEIFVVGVFDQCRLVAVDCKTGDRLWSWQSKGWVGPSPTITSDAVYISSQDKHAYRINRETGEMEWSFKTGSWCSSEVAVRGDRAFLPANDGFFYCLNAKSGEVVWKFKMIPAEGKTKMVYTDPVLTDRAIYFVTGEGQVYAVDYDGQLIWRMRPSDDSELFCDIAHDGQRMFVVNRRNPNVEGVAAVQALGIVE